MSRERLFIEKLRGIACAQAARGLLDDAAVLAVGEQELVLTHDMLVEGVHFLSSDPAGDVAWKLLAVNLSDLAAKGARPVGVLMGYALGATDYDAAFAAGLAEALAHFDVPLLGGDTVRMPAGAPRALGLTAIGLAPPDGTPARGGAQAGDLLYVTGTIGLAGLGLAAARGLRDGPADALAAYRRPVPRLAEGQDLASRVHAMTDVSDGLLIDAARMADASGVSLAMDLDAVPLMRGAERMAALTAGDDYELLIAAPAGLTYRQPGLATLSTIGRFDVGSGLTLHDAGGAVPLPARLGYEHDAT